MTVHTNPLADAIADLHEGRTTPTEYAESSLDRLEAAEDDVHAFLPEEGRRDRVLGAAESLEDEYVDGDRPPLYGVPVGVKDIYHVDGFETHAGSSVPPEALAGPQSDVVTALLDAGALVLGKTVTAEFAYFEPGPTRNPHDLGHTPGGSSSGSAAAVAAGVTPLAVGTQTYGSIVRPAAFCGIVGVKPTYDRVPMSGIFPVSESADHAGYFTQDVAGARHAAPVFYDEFEDVSPDEKPVLGVPDDAYLSQADDETLAHFEARLEDLRDAGYEVRRTDALADIASVNERHDDMVAGEAALAHDELYADYGDQYADSTAGLLADGRDVSVGRLVDCRNGRRALRDRLAEAMDETGVDAWVAPSAPGPAPEGIDSTGDPVMDVPWTHACVPVVGLPAGELDDLPVGIQFAGRFGDDERLLAWCADLADVLGDG
ncbi:amidase [Halobacterium wangiae]|uniref:amidase n=1 Tax=Halobacterium wangiae TaxID=2902623 RepID=UPI001E59BC8C|nr:amidase [Halobacterium wangiae]